LTALICGIGVLPIDRLEADATCNLYPAMYEITGGIPEPIFDEPQEAESLGRTWQALIGSQTLRRRSSTRYEKGTGDPPKRHQRGNILKTRIDFSIRVFDSSIDKAKRVAKKLYI
jgi:hypothetical protein